MAYICELNNLELGILEIEAKEYRMGINALAEKIIREYVWNRIENPGYPTVGYLSYSSGDLERMLKVVEDRIEALEKKEKKLKQAITVVKRKEKTKQRREAALP